MFRICMVVLLLCLKSLSVQAESLPTFKVVASNGQLSPSSLTVPAGRRIKLEIYNQGKTPIEFENLQMHVEKVLAPSAQSYLVLNPMKPGTYRFIDEFHPQTGKLDLIVK